MRPQYNRRASRAIAALGVGVIAAAGGSAAALAASGPAPSAAPGSSAATGRLLAAPLALARPGSGAASAAAAHRARPTTPRRRPAAARRPSHRVRHVPHLHAVMLHHDVLVGQDVAFVGLAHPGRARRLIGVQRRLGRRWVEVARARTDAHGRFHVRYWPNVLGRVRLRLAMLGVRGRGAVVKEPVATVFHQVVASWYGPGGTTACGETLLAGTQGVANRTLPCGTMVTLRYQGRTVRVPVIDRGPFVAGRDYDLTYATKLALGAGDVTVIWASA